MLLLAFFAIVRQYGVSHGQFDKIYLLRVVLVISLHLHGSEVCAFRTVQRAAAAALIFSP